MKIVLRELKWFVKALGVGLAIPFLVLMTVVSGLVIYYLWEYYFK